MLKSTQIQNRPSIILDDWFGRNEAVTVMTKNPTDDTVTDYASVSSQYGYVTANGVTTNLVSSVNNTVTGSEGTSTANYGYTYDGNGKITGITAVSNVTGLSSASQYIYDEAGQLVKEIKGSDYTEYAYDSKGNISTRKVYSNNTLVSTDNFTYGSEAWEDRLTGYNNKTIAYDNIGNPTSYLGATLTWRGRELESYTKGNIQISYSYDVDGMRYQKVVKTDGVETSRYDYVYSEGSLILITFTADGVSDTARFIYDSYGEPRGFILNNTAAYLYLKNAQGDITGIVNENGEVILTCSYDAWGRVIFGSTNMAHMTLAAKLSQINPFTYRGYCYDYDIGMYYLQSRYYDPEIGRFINADSTDYLGATGTLLSYNLFAYCENDGVNFVDENGFYTCYAFSMTNKTSFNTVILKSSKQAVKMGVPYLKIVKKHNTMNFKTTETTNASKITYNYNSLYYYIDYRYNSQYARNVLTRSHFYKRTYSGWLIYIESRHETIFDKIETKVKKALKMSDTDWITFTQALGDCEFPPQFSYIETGMLLYDVLSVFLKFMTKWLDEVDNYILHCLESFSNLKNSKTLISILWKVDNYTYCFANSGTGYRKGWHLNKTYWAYKY